MEEKERNEIQKIHIFKNQIRAHRNERPGRPSSVVQKRVSIGRAHNAQKAFYFCVVGTTHRRRKWCTIDDMKREKKK